MNPIYWLESFSEEEETVKKVSDQDHRTFKFRKEPVQAFEPDFFDSGSIVSIRTHSRFEPSIIDQIDCVISRSTGYDHLLRQSQLLENTVVGSLSKYATEAVADYNLAVGFALSRKLSQSEQSIKSFERNNLTGREFTSLEPGVIGVGDIGRTTAVHLLNMGLNVRGHDPEHHSRLKTSERFEYTSLQNVFKKCDLVFLCLPHNESTHQMIDRTLLGQLPEDSLLVNSGRGEVVRNQTLLKSLRHGPLSGLGLDVFNREESLRSHLRKNPLENEVEDPEVQAALDLLRDDCVLATPHNAFNSRQAVEKKVKQTLDNIEMYRQEGRLYNPIPEGDLTQN